MLDIIRAALLAGDETAINLVLAIMGRTNVCAGITAEESQVLGNLREKYSKPA